MIKYFKADIKNTVGTEYREEYSVGICGEDWSLQDASNFLKIWLEEFEKEAKLDNFECLREHSIPIICSKETFNNCWIKIEDFQIR